MAPPRKGFRAPQRAAPPRAAASQGTEDGSSLGFIPADPVDARLTIEGAVCGSDGKLDIEAYEDVIQCWAGEPPPEQHPDPMHPGVRSGEEVPKGLRMWDDVRAGSTTGGKAKDGAGWVAVKNSSSRKREKWFNIRTCGSWRLAFLLARLQRALWEREDLPPTSNSGAVGAVLQEVSTGQKITPTKRLLKRTPSSPTKRLKRQPSAESTPNKIAKLARKASAEGGEGKQADPPGQVTTDAVPKEMTAAQKRMQQMKERIAARTNASA